MDIGYIYKITNLMNNKLYIGQTKKTIEERFRLHKLDSLRTDRYCYNYPLYRAFRKYGFQNFKIELLEKCSIKQLNEREIYWINFYNTYKKGYNQTLGGEGSKKLEFDENEIIKDYKELKTIEKVSHKYNCSSSTITQILKKHNIYIKSFIEQAKEKSMNVKRYDLNGNLLEEYDNLYLAGEWLIKNELTKSKNPRNAGITLKKHLWKEDIFQGFIWKTDFYTLEEKIHLIDSEQKYKKQYNHNCNTYSYKKQLICPICNEMMDKNAKSCMSCFRKQQQDYLYIFSKNEIKDILRNNNLEDIYKMPNLSRKKLTNICNYYNLPYKSSEIKKYSKEEWDKL